MKNISVVCTVYNDQNEILDLLNDIENQTLLPDEIVIADGGSKDDTINIIEKYDSKCNIRLLKGKRLNISQGLNEAIKSTKNEIIVIMSTGNRYKNNFIEEIYSKISDDNEIVYVPIRGTTNNKFSKIYCKAFLNGERGSRIPSNHGVLIKKSVFKKVGLFYEDFVYAGEDAEFFDRTYKNGIKQICADTAILKWGVPESLKEFKKQIKNYTIAKIQINSYGILKNYKNLAFMLLLLVFSIIMIFVNIKISLLFGLLFVLALIYKFIKKNGILPYFLIIYRQFKEIEIIIKNRKYFSHDYKIKNSNIKKL